MRSVEEMPKINYHDWDLHDQGSLDAERFKEKVKEAVRKNLKDLIIDESIISQQGNKKIKVPMHGLREYYFNNHLIEHGYCRSCATEAIKYVSELLNK